MNCHSYKNKKNYCTEAVQKKIQVFFFVLSLVTLNIGFNDYLSAPILCLTIMLFLLLGQEKIYISKNLKYLLIFGTAFSIFPISILLIKKNEFHSSLSQLRELTFLVLIIYMSKSFKYFDKEIDLAFSISVKIILLFVAIQFFQAWIGISILTLPEKWMMLNYGNSLQSEIINGSEYVRPVAFYSEPSVVASIIVPAFFIALKKSRKLMALLCLLTLLITSSMFGFIGAVLIIFFCDSRNKIFKFLIVIVLSFSFFYFYSHRTSEIFSGKDLSYLWRVEFPIQYVLNKFNSRNFLPIPIAEIFEYSNLYYDGASITDTWPIFTIARLGIFGPIWIFIVMFFLPKKMRIIFIFLSVVSGAPLYQDKALLMILFYRVAYGKNNI